MESNSEPVQATPSSAEIAAQLELVLSSRLFMDSPRLAEFLRYVVNETLAGRAGRIKGFTVAQEVFGREDPDDAQTSTVVRVEAGRLRRCLSDYYSGEGNRDKIHIEIPKGAYVPTFSHINPIENPSNNIGQKNENGEQPEKQSASNIRYKIFLPAAAVCVVIALAVWYYVSSGENQALVSTDTVFQFQRTDASRPSIAVMPFDNAFQDPQYGSELARGLTEDIITDLSRLTEVDVVALSSVQAFDTGADLNTIAEQLQVSHVLRGSVRGKPSRVRVTAQLYDSQNGTQVWADRFDRQIGDILDLEDELAVKIAEGLSLELEPDLLKKRIRRGTENPEAYALFNQAMSLVNPPTDAGRLRVSRAAFERIIEMDPGFAGGYAGVAYTTAFLAFWGHTRSPQTEIETTITFANKAIERDASFGIAYSALAFARLSRGEFDEAVAVSENGVSRQPNDPYVNAYHGFILAANGSAGEGVPYLRRALFLDPLNPRTPFLNILGYVLFLTGEPQKSLEAMVRSQERGGPVSPGNTLVRVVALISLGRTDEARELANSVKKMNTGFNLKAWSTWVDRSFRNQEDKDKWLDPLKEIGLL